MTYPYILESLQRINGLASQLIRHNIHDNTFIYKSRIDRISVNKNLQGIMNVFNYVITEIYKNANPRQIRPLTNEHIQT